MNLKQYFTNNMWSLNSAKGSYDKAYAAFYEIVDKRTHPVSKQPITKEYLVQTYKDYLKYKKDLAQNGGSFKDREIESIHAWLMQGLFENNYAGQGTSNESRDNYLYSIDY
jgi:hypothetical protein